MNDGNSMRPAVALRRIRKRLATRVILDDVSLEIHRGEFFALLGPSGSGKSTLLKMVSGIDLPDEGEVWLGSRDVTALPPYRRPVHTVFQNYALFPHLDVIRNVSFPLRVAGVSRAECLARAREALEWVRLAEFAERRVDYLSGGERQRVALARALVNQPECVLLDEPLSALDPHLRGHTLELLQDLQARLNLTYLYVTHDREEALRAAHRIGILRDGRLQQVGTPRDVYHHPCSAFVAAFVGPISWLRGELTPLPKGSALRLRTGECIPLPSDAPPRPGPAILGVRPEAMQIVRGGTPSCLRVKVTGRQFAGSTISLRLAAADGSVLLAEVRADQPCPEVAEHVDVGWDASAAHVYFEESPSSDPGI